MGAENLFGQIPDAFIRDEEEIIIDLTNSFIDESPEEIEEVLITGEDIDKKPTIITLTPTQVSPDISEAPQKSDDIIQFTPQLQTIDTDQLPLSDPDTEALAPEDVTPIVKTEELKTFFQDTPAIDPVPVSDQVLEVIDLRGSQDDSEFALISDDENILIPELSIEVDEEPVTEVEDDVVITTTSGPIQITTPQTVPQSQVSTSSYH